MRHAIPLTDNSFGRETRNNNCYFLPRRTKMTQPIDQKHSEPALKSSFSTLDFSFEITGIHRGLVLSTKLDNKLPGWPWDPEETPGRRHRSKDLRSPTESERFVYDLWRPVHMKKCFMPARKRTENPFLFPSVVHILYFINKTRIIFVSWWFMFNIFISH